MTIQQDSMPTLDPIIVLKREIGYLPELAGLKYAPLMGAIEAVYDSAAETAELRTAADHVNRYLIGYTKGMGEDTPPLMARLQEALAAALKAGEAK